MTDSNFTLKYGKHVGKTYAWVLENDPSYISWAKKNAPNILKPPVIKQLPSPKINSENSKQIKANLNFDNEGPDNLSLPYLNKLNETKSFFDLEF